MIEFLGTTFVIGFAIILFALMALSLVTEFIDIRKENKRIEQAARFIDPLPDVVRIAPEQAHELECWPVLDKSNRD